MRYSEDKAGFKLSKFRPEMAIASFFFGIPSLCAFFLITPGCALALCLPGLALGIAGYNTERKELAAIGIGASLTTFVILLVNTVIDLFILR